MGLLLSHGLVFFKMVPNLASYKTVSYLNSLILSFFFKRGCRHGDPISPYIFILCAKILGKMVRDNEIITGININGKEFRLSQ